MNLLITGAWHDAESSFPLLRKAGHTVCLLKQETDPLPCSPTWVEGVVCNGLFLHHPIESFPNLRFIQLTSAGFDRVPMEYVRDKAIEIKNAQGVYSVPMAEYALAGILAHYKSFVSFQHQQEKHLWQKNRGLLELYGKKAVIIGCGHTGTACAERLHAFGVSIIGVNRTVRTIPGFDRIVGLEDLDQQLVSADIVIVSIALTDETRSMVKASLLKPEAVLVNISRGPVVDLRDMVCGAVLDVFDPEPLDADSSLWDRDRTIITPHISFIGDGNASRLRDLILKNLGVLS